MIEKALQFTRDVVNQYFKNKFGLDEDAVVINRIVDQGGNSPIENTNKVVLSLINVELETINSFNLRRQILSNKDYTTEPRVQRYNLDVLIVPHFTDYKEGLKFLNASIEFFQINLVLDGSINSNMPIGIEKLEFEQEKIDYHQMQNLWIALGAKFQPSIVYKMRLITTDSGPIDGFASEVIQTSNSVKE